MKKGQKVRVLADGRVGVVADSHFFHWGHKKMVQHQVKFPDTKGEAPWFPSDKLTTNLVEKTNMVFMGEAGTLHLIFSYNHDKGTSCLEFRGETPEDLAKHKGMHMALAGALVEGLLKRYDLRPSNEVDEY